MYIFIHATYFIMFALIHTNIMIIIIILMVRIRFLNPVSNRRALRVFGSAVLITHRLKYIKNFWYESLNHILIFHSASFHTNIVGSLFGSRSPLLTFSSDLWAEKINHQYIRLLDRTMGYVKTSIRDCPALVLLVAKFTAITVGSRSTRPTRLDSKPLRRRIRY